MATTLTTREALSHFNSAFGIVLVNGKTVLVRFADDDLIFYSLEDVRKFTRHLATWYADKKMLALDYWMENEKANRFLDIVFEPGKPVANAGNGQPLNLWKGWAWRPERGRCERFLEHIHEVICDGHKDYYDYVVAWLANLVQRPDKRPGVALVLRGGQGVGKGIFANAIGKLLKPAHYLHLASSDLLVGRFSSHFAGKLLVFADESFWAGDKKAEGRLKALITEDTLTVEPKGAPPFTIRNLVRLIIASNERWIVPAGLDERRYFVLDVSDKRRGDFDYFEKIVEELEAGGYAALLHHLLFEVDLSGVNLRKAPETPALLEQKLETADTVVRFWYETLIDGALFEKNAVQGFVDKTAVFSDYKASVVKTRYRESQPVFWRKTFKIFGELPEKRLRRGGYRPRVVRLPDEGSARKRLLEVLKGNIRI